MIQRTKDLQGSAHPTGGTSMGLVSMKVEARRLKRSGLLLALIASFAFFGLSGPVLALFMPQILGAANENGQLTIEAATPTPDSALMMFSQSAMQLGLIFAVAIAVTSMNWDARPGSSIFYRTRNKSLALVLLPRLALDAVAVVAAYAVGALCTAVLSAFTIGRIPADHVLRMTLAAALYLVMCMSIGLLIMSASRRTAAAIALSTVLALVLPLAGFLPGAAAHVPSVLVNGASLDWAALLVPAIVAVAVTALCLVGAVRIASTRSLRRDA